METFIRFLIEYQSWIYGILGLTGLIYLRRLIYAIGEYRSTIFGLERENAQRRLNSSLVMLVLAVMLSLSEFVTAKFIGPELLKTLANQPTTEASAPTAEGTTEAGSSLIIINPNEEAEPTTTETITGCTPGLYEWISPDPGEEISGSYMLQGTLNITGITYAQYFYASSDTPDNWRSIAVVYPTIIEGDFGSWETDTVTNGDYTLRLVAKNMDGSDLPPCEVSIRVMNEEE